MKKTTNGRITTALAKKKKQPQKSDLKSEKFPANTKTGSKRNVLKLIIFAFFPIVYYIYKKVYAITLCVWRLVYFLLLLLLIFLLSFLRCFALQFICKMQSSLSSHLSAHTHRLCVPCIVFRVSINIIRFLFYCFLNILASSMHT